MRLFEQDNSRPHAAVRGIVHSVRRKRLTWCLFISVCIGVAGIAEWRRARERERLENQREQIQRLVASMGGNFSHVTVTTSSHPANWLVGYVPHSDDRDALFTQLSGRYGKIEAERMLHNLRDSPPLEAKQFRN